MSKTVKKSFIAVILAMLLILGFTGGHSFYLTAGAQDTTQSKTLSNILNENNQSKGGAKTGTLYEYELMYGNVASGTLTSFDETDTFTWQSAESNNFESGTVGVQINAGYRIYAPGTEVIVRVKALQNMRLTVTHPELTKDTAWQFEQSYLTVYYAFEAGAYTYKQIAMTGKESVAENEAGAVIDVPSGATIYWTYKTESTRYLSGAQLKELTFAADTATYDADSALNEREGYSSAFHSYQNDSSAAQINTLIRQTAQADGNEIIGRDLTAQLLYGKVDGTLNTFKANASKTELQTQSGTQYATNWKIFATAAESFIYAFTADRYDTCITLTHEAYTNDGWSDDGGYIRTYVKRSDKLTMLTEVNLKGRGKASFAQNELFGGLTAISLSQNDVFYVEFGIQDTVTSQYNVTSKLRFVTAKGANSYQTAAIGGAELDAYYQTFNADDYSAEGKTRLAAALAAAKAKYIVDTAAVTNDAGKDSALAAAKALLDAVPTADEEIVANALAEIEAMYAELERSDYSEENWTALEKAYTTAKTNAQSVTSVEQADEVVAAYSQTIAGTKTILDAYKDEKIAALAAYYDESNYSAANQTRLAGFVTSYTAAIRSAATINLVDAQVTAYQTAVDGVATLAQELAASKAKYTALIDTYRSELAESAYSEAALSEIDGIVAEVKDDINGCATAEEVKRAYDDAVARLLAVTTVVGEYRQAKKAEIETYIDAMTGEYSASAQAELQNIYDDYAARIDTVEVTDASIEADVTAAKQEIDELTAAAKAEIDDVQTVAEQLEAYKADCIAEIKAYLDQKSSDKGESLKAAAQAVVTAAETAINNASTSEAIAKLTAQAKFDIDEALEPAAVRSKEGCGSAAGTVSSVFAVVALACAACIVLRRKEV